MPKLDSRTTSYDSRDEGESASHPPPPNLPTSPHMPTRTGTNSSDPAVPPWSPSGRPPHAYLLVDDDEVCRRLSSKFLHVFGCSIDYAVDGMSAVSKMNAQRYDLVLMDIVMPNPTVCRPPLLSGSLTRVRLLSVMTSNSGRVRTHELYVKWDDGYVAETVYQGWVVGDVGEASDAFEGCAAWISGCEYRQRSTGEAGGIKRESQPTPRGTGDKRYPKRRCAEEGDGVNPLAGMGFTTRRT